MNFIQPITKNEIEILAVIKAAAFNASPWNDNWSIENAEISMKQDFSCPGFYGVYMESEGEIIGYVQGQKRLFMDKLTFHIDELCIHPEHQRKGFGAALLSYLKKELAAQDVSEISLMTGQNASIHRFYQQAGFQLETDVVIMNMELRSEEV